MNPLIETKNLTRTYHQGEVEVPALKHVNFTVQPGEFLALVGPSGSGKTTLLNMIGGLDHVTAGSVSLDGMPLQEMSASQLSAFRRDHIGFVFQSYNLIPVLTAAENVEYVLLLQGVPEEERRQRVYAMLKEVGLQGMEDRLPSQLSGGQQQRVAIARAMVSQPRLILADEPTANVDSHTGAELLNLMEELNHVEGMTFVFSTHDPAVMERAHRVVQLKDGEICADELKE